jgi:aspartate/methionine/tyrosine aminotransferase
LQNTKPNGKTREESLFWPRVWFAGNHQTWWWHLLCKQASRRILYTYCPGEGLPERREAIQNKVRNKNNLSDYNVMVTAGANQGYMNCILALLGDGDQCAFFQPYYFNHIMATQLAVGG